MPWGHDNQQENQLIDLRAFILKLICILSAYVQFLHRSAPPHAGVRLQCISQEFKADNLPISKQILWKGIQEQRTLPYFTCVVSLKATPWPDSHNASPIQGVSLRKRKNKLCTVSFNKSLESINLIFITIYYYKDSYSMTEDLLGIKICLKAECNQKWYRIKKKQKNTLACQHCYIETYEELLIMVKPMGKDGAFLSSTFQEVKTLPHTIHISQWCSCWFEEDIWFSLRKDFIP